MAVYKVFAQEGCGSCRNVLNILKQNKIDFNLIDVSTREGLTTADKYGVTHTGVILDENDNEVSIQEVIKRESK